MKTKIKENLYIAEKRLERYLNAEEAILSGQSYEMGDRKLTRANLKDVVNTINSLKKEIAALETILNGRARVRIVRPSW
ncbi:MAG: hypothetical protein IJ859_09440 [Synergistaceae bacterium]|nr:hypothetical protein [Synergistaceae bacterium]